jgi:hypothetical protein
VGPFGFSNKTFDSDVIDLPIKVATLTLSVEVGVGTSVIVRIVPWVGKVLACCRGSWISGGGSSGGLASVLTCGLVLFAIGYVICGIGGGYVICGADKG